MKQKIVALLRRAHLLQLADHIRYVWELKRAWRSRKEFVERNPDFSLPPTDLAYDAYGHTDWEGYYNSGKEHAKYFSNLINEYVDKQAIKVCEWGCGPARVLRHLSQFFDDGSIDLYGFDYNPRTIEWCRENIRNIKFLPNLLAPPLVCEPDTFDCLYCISVFTHLSQEMHFQWIAELSRTVKPGGVIILTTHGDTCRQKLHNIELQKYDRGELVVRGDIKEGKRCFLAYHPPSFMRNELFKNLEVISHIPSSAHLNLIHQDVWVIRNTKPT